MNGIRHGLYTEVTLIAGESEAELVAFGKRLRADLAPVGEVELMLADRIVSLAWRLRRLIAIEGTVMEDSARASSYDASPGRAFGGSSGDKMMRVSAYEAKLDRQLFKTMHELQRLQAARRGVVVTPPEAIDVSVSSDRDEDADQPVIEAVAVASIVENSGPEIKKSNALVHRAEHPESLGFSEVSGRVDV
ncbi:MAG: hypothetical protein ACOYLQ_10080 [Hyphomicrobiaceae bacterium]